MICPACRQFLVIVEFQRVEIDLCLQCRGIWFDRSELCLLFETAGLPEQTSHLEENLEKLPARSSPRARRCPRCRRRMVQVEAAAGEGPVMVDRCPLGHGLWFDQGELESLLAGALAGEVSGLATVTGFLGRFGKLRRSGGNRN